MNQDEVIDALSQALPGCQVTVAIDGSHFNLVVVSDLFQGARTVKRQQMVYGALASPIASGAIHAVNMLTLTPAEWAVRQNQS